MSVWPVLAAAAGSRLGPPRPAPPRCSSQAAFVPNARLAPIARQAAAPVMAMPKGELVRPIASAAIALPTLMAATPALALDANDLVLPVGSLTVLLTFILSLVIGYTVLGDGPANPTRK